MVRRFLLLFLCVLLAVGSASAALQNGTMKVFAVTDSGAALNAELALEIVKGNGKIWTSVTPLVGTSTQTTERIAVELAKKYASDVDNYDYLFDINSDASLVEGPSAGAAMALLVITMLQEKPLPQNVGITGTITEDGLVGNVGGVFEKSKEAARIGVKLFLIPVGESQQIIREGPGLQAINLQTYALEQWGMKVVEVTNIDDALELAFTEIGEIDINKAKQEIPEFVPDQITYSKDLGEMARITRQLVESTEAEVNDAKESLSTTLLRDTKVIGVLLKSISSAESDIKHAKQLMEQNYLFSAANLAFLAKVNAAFVKDISEKPSILASDSVVFDLKLLNLKTELNALKSDLNSFMAVEQLEWHIAAQQRVSWAELKLEKLESPPAIIDTGASEAEIILGRIQDMEFAAAWIGVAKDFFAVSIHSKRKAVLDDFFLGDADNYLIKAQEGLRLVSEDESADAQEKIDAAKRKKEYGWYAASAFDSAFSLALSQEVVFSEGKSLAELKESLSSGIAELDSKIEESNNGFIWSQLYLDHARYFSKATVYYESHGQFTRASDAAKNGISLLFLAQNLFEVTSKLKSYYVSLPAEKLLSGKPAQTVSQQPLVLDNEKIYFVAIILLVVVLLVLVVTIVLLLKNIREYRAISLANQLDYIRVKEKKLEKGLAGKKISKADYEKEKTALEASYKEIMLRKENISSAMIKLNTLQSKLLSHKLALRRIKKQHEKGFITKTHLEKAEKELEKQVKRDIGEIKMQEALIKEAGQQEIKRREIAKPKKELQAKNEKQAYSFRQAAMEISKTGQKSGLPAVRKEDLPAVSGNTFARISAEIKKPVKRKKAKKKGKN